MDSIAQEKEEVHRCIETSRLTADIMQKQDRENRFHWIFHIFTGLLIACLVFLLFLQQANMEQAVSKAIAESQETFNNAMIKALNTVAEIGAESETVTQTVEGDSAYIQNIDGDQYNDNAQKVGDGG